MQARRRFTPRVGVCLSVMGLVMALGITPATLAQKDAPTAKSDPDRVLPLPPVGDLPAPNPNAQTSPLRPVGDVPAPSPDAKTSPLRPVGDVPAPSRSAPTSPAPAIESVPVGGSDPVEFSGVPVVTEPAKVDSAAVAAGQPSTAPGALAADDPEKAAQDFAERTRKEADTAIKSLSAEAETLRARLRKVEAGLQRWQALQAALDQNTRKTASAPKEKRAWRQQADGRDREPAPRTTARTIESVPTGDLPLPPETARTGRADFLPKR